MGWQGAPAHRGPPEVSLLISANGLFSPVADELSRSGPDANDVGSACERREAQLKLCSALGAAAALTLSPHPNQAGLPKTFMRVSFSSSTRDPRSEPGTQPPLPGHSPGSVSPNPESPAHRKGTSPRPRSSVESFITCHGKEGKGKEKGRKPHFGHYPACLWKEAGLAKGETA